MAAISNEKLAGVVAGALLFRAAESIVSVVGQFLIPGIDMTARIAMSLPPVLGAVIGGLLGCAYLSRTRGRWVATVTSVLLSLSAVVSLIGIATPFLSTFGGDAMVRRSLLSTHLGQLALAAALLTAVVVLAKREKKTNSFRFEVRQK